MTALLPSKFFLPRRNPSTVVRPRLLEILDANLWRKLHVIVAPAGAGKSTLVVDWLHQREHVAAWIALEPADNHLALFVRALVQGLAEHDAQIEPEALEAMLRARGPMDPALMLGELVVRPLSARKERLVLVLDDYHVIDEPAVHEATSFLIDALPPSLHVVMATRRRPGLPLSRWSARDEMHLLDAASLRFQDEETEAFFNEAMGLSLDKAVVAEFEQRTEGWAVGLQLSALGLRNGAVLDGERLMSDYLVDEVLERQTPERRAFLLATCVLDQMCGELCDALTGTQDGQEELESLWRDDLFVIPLDDHEGWWRYHHLFGELLRKQLGAERARELHRRAAAWYVDQRAYKRGVHHGRASGDPALWLTCMEASGGELLYRSELETLRAWFDAVGEELLATSAQLLAIDAWVEVLSGDAERALLRVEQSMACADEEGCRVLEGNWAAVRSFAAERLGQFHEGVDWAERALETIDPTQEGIRVAVELNLGLLLRARGDLEDAESALARCESYDVHENPFALLWGMAQRGELLAWRGEVEQAGQVLSRCKALGQQTRLARVGAISHAEQVYAWLALHLDDLDKAAEHIKAACESMRRVRFPAEMATVEALGARIDHARGDKGQALERLAAAREIATIHHDANKHAEVEVMAAYLALLDGDMVALERWAKRPMLEALRSPEAKHQAELCLAICDRGPWPGDLDSVPVLPRIAWLAVSDQHEAMWSLVETTGLAHLARVHGARVRTFDGVLSAREREVLELVARGMTNKAIAGELFVSVGTVKTHVHNILGKLEVDNRTQAVHRARHQGLLGDSIER